MEGMDQKLISIFEADQEQPELLQSMRDIVAFSGVLTELNDKDYFQSPAQVLRFLRVIHLINMEALGLSDVLEDENQLFYRYRHVYEFDQEISLGFVKHLIYVLGKYNWITKTSRRIKMRDLGKRMIDVLIRLANDSLAYYLNDEVARSLFQAKRDAELSEAYDDKGISGGNKLASMIRNVEEAIELLAERELEYLADRNALTQVEVIHQLMQELEIKISERIAKFETLDQELVFASIKQRGITAISEGTKISIGTINKILKFSHLSKTDTNHTIKPELLRQFIEQTFAPALDSDIPNAHQILSFMEQEQYEEESIDGMWVPIKFASPIASETIDIGIDYLDNYQPITEEIDEKVDEIFTDLDEVMESDIDTLMGDAKWQMTKRLIHTDKLEAYLDQVEEAGLDDLIVKTGSSDWDDVLNGLIGVSALISNKKVNLDEKANKEYKADQTKRNWRWIDDEQGKYGVRKKRKYRKP